MHRSASWLLISAGVFLAGCTTPVSRPADYDIVIRHGRIIDGTGRQAMPGDVAIRDGRIVAVGSAPGTARTEIDATGKVITPGFIDVHTHSEEITELPFAENFLRMGVTTIITGNCGMSAVDLGEYFAGLERTKVGPNVGALIGQGRCAPRSWVEVSCVRPLPPNSIRCERWWRRRCAMAPSA